MRDYNAHLFIKLRSLLINSFTSYIINLTKNVYPLLLGLCASIFVPIYIAVPLLVIATFFTGYNVINSTKIEVLQEAPEKRLNYLTEKDSSDI